MTIIRIRGIYTSALTKFLVSKGYMVNQMSDAMRERFPNQETHDAPNVDIKHSRDLNGISLVGDRESLNKIAKDFEESFTDIFILKSNIDLYGIYKGRVIKTNNESIVNLGQDVGILPELTKDEDVLVQVLEMNDKPILTMRITFSGEYCVIIPEDDVKISRKIHDENERRRLFDIGNKAKQKNFGILWRTSSEYVEEKILLGEAEKLSSNAEYVMEKFAQLEEPGIIKAGKSHMNIIFGGPAKKKLDNLRSSIAPTLSLHHMLKSSGRDVSFAVDVVEKIKVECDVPTIDQIFHSVFRQIKGPKIGDDIVLEHVKPAARPIYIEGGKVKKYAPPYIKLKRYFLPRGYYEGLNIKKENGDYALTEMEEGQWHFKYVYYDKNNNIKGEYYNICTPIEIFPTKIRYVDLEAAVIKYPDGVSKILNEDVVYKRVEEGIFSKKIAEIVMNEAVTLKNLDESEIL